MYGGNKRELLLAIWCVLALMGSAPLASEFRVSVEKVAPLTGPDAPTDMRTADVCGTDIGTMAELGDRIYFAFGDTFGFQGLACPRFGPNWRSNVLAYTSEMDAENGITIDGWLSNDDGKAVAVTEGAHQPAFTGENGEQTRIPTAMVAVGERLYLHYMSVHGFAARGGEWSCNYSQFLYSDDAGQTWTETAEKFGGKDSKFNMLALSASAGRGNEDSAFVYAIGTACGRFGAGYAARVRSGSLADPSEWEYFDGSNWVKDSAFAARVIPPIAGEGSLVWNAGLGRWMYTTLNQNAEAIQLHLADTPWGPFDETYDLVSGREYAALYGAYMTPRLISEDGRTFYFIMSQFGPYNTYVMKAELSDAGQ